MLTPQGQIAGAVLDGKVLSADQALQLWQAHAWQPAVEGQAMPVVPPGVAKNRAPRLQEPQW